MTSSCIYRSGHDHIRNKVYSVEGCCWLVVGKLFFGGAMWSLEHDKSRVPLYAVRFITILSMALWWQEQNLNQTSNSQQTPRATGCLLGRFWRNIGCLITAPHCSLHFNCLFDLTVFNSLQSDDSQSLWQGRHFRLKHHQWNWKDIQL